MKTRLLIILGIVLTAIVFGTHQSLMYSCGTLPVFMETPRNPNLWNCLEIWENTLEQHPNAPPPVNLSAERNSDWITGEDYCHEWCDNDELYSLRCDQPILAHLTKYSNLLDEDFDGSFYIDWIGLSDGISTEKFEWCVDYIFEKRILELYKDTPEVIAFYAKYEDTQVSVREDHVSYFAGNEDDFRVRMNLEFDENYEIENIEFHCYVEREHQTEVPQTFILRFLEDWTCNEYGTQRNEN